MNWKEDAHVVPCAFLTFIGDHRQHFRCNSKVRFIDKWDPRKEEMPYQFQPILHALIWLNRFTHTDCLQPPCTRVQWLTLQYPTLLNRSIEFSSSTVQMVAESSFKENLAVWPIVLTLGWWKEIVTVHKRGLFIGKCNIDSEKWNENGYYDCIWMLFLFVFYGMGRGYHKDSFMKQMLL